ncbi:MAG: hypothetical protein ACHBN1_29600 [Heteroscytonema crispum UTEX LB 1556]
MLRIICTEVSNSVSAKGKIPLINPNIKPILPPRSKRAIARAALMPILRNNSPESDKLIAVINASILVACQRDLDF